MKEGDSIMNLLFKILLLFSSYIPIIIMIFLNNLKSFNLYEIINVYNRNSCFWNLCLILSFISIIVLFLWLKILKKDAKSSTKLYELGSLDNNDGEVLNYFVTYIIPLLSLKVNETPSIIMNLLLILIEGIYFIKNNALHFNPLLLIFGYHVYTDTNNNIVISKKKLFTIKNENLKADQFGTSNIFYID